MFDSTIKYFAFGAALLADAEAMRNTYGATANTAPDHSAGVDVLTLLCGLDNTDTGKLRAMRLGVDAVPIMLSDGRYCLGGYWTLAAVNAFTTDVIDGEELTVAEVKALTPQSNI